MLKKTQNYIVHVLCCLIFISLPFLASPDFKSDDLLSIPPFQRDLLSHLLLLAFFYASYCYFIPNFLFRKKKALYTCAVFFSFLIVMILPAALIHGDSPTSPYRGGLHGDAVIPRIEAGYSFQFIMVFFLSLLLRTNQRMMYLRDEKLKTEISYLKAQINPHFLFNTLNSLYALALSKSEDAPEAILKLSSMMRYVVSESSKDHVSLDKEIEYIKNYISLQQLRMDGSIHFEFIVTGNATGKQISPLILIPFIENAFKYGLNPEQDSSICIRLDISDDDLQLEVSNNKVVHNLPEGEASGMGMENTRQRLKYLYPKKHKLLIIENNEAFNIKLTLSLE